MSPAPPREPTASSDPAAAPASDHPPRPARAAIGRLLALAGLCSIALAQPTLDLLGENPEVFQVNRITGSSITVFAIAVIAIPPLLLWIAGEASTGVSGRAGRVVHLGLVAALFGLIGVLFSKELTTIAALNSLTGVAAAVGGTYSYLRFAAVGTWVRLLSAANLLLLAQFVFVAPVSDWTDRGAQSTVEFEADPDLEEPPPSVVMLVFDEWPTQSILGDDEGVDARRFPNLAAFANDATWYRHFTSVSPFTPTAVPALVDGLDPHGKPTWVDHPDSLFSLLGGSHHMIVSESISQLCGLPGCGVRPVAPPPIDATEVVALPPTTIDTSPRWGRLLETARTIWIDRVTPGSAGEVETFDDFVEEVTPVEPPPVEDDPPPNETDADAGIDDETIALERFLATLVDVQPDRHTLFVGALQPTDVPFVGFLHLLLPHQPWAFRESGSEYAVAAHRRDFTDNGDPWPVQVMRQRHILQAQYADRLLGIILNRLEEIDEYDDTIVIVASDHGIAFEVDESSRVVSDLTREQIAYSLLFVKGAGQRTGIIDDANVNSTDVLPTIADMVGVELPWTTDGSAIGSPEIAERGSDKYIHKFGEPFEYEYLGREDYDDDEAYQDLLDGRFPALGDNDNAIAALYRGIAGSDLIGMSPELSFGPINGTASVIDLPVLLEPEGNGPPPGEIAGRVADAEPGSTVVVAVNNRVVGVSPLYVRDGVDDNFVILLPAGALEATTNSVRLGLRSADGVTTELSLDGLAQ